MDRRQPRQKRLERDYKDYESNDYQDVADGQFEPFSFEFSYGTVDVYADRVTIHRRATLMTLSSPGRPGDKTIYFDSIIGIEKHPGTIWGGDFAYIELETAQHGLGTGSMCENSLAYKPSISGQMDGDFAALTEVYSAYKARKNIPASYQNNNLHQIKHLKELLDIGAISQDEYDVAKDRLLRFL